jgi:hypothetical protein
MFGVSDTAEADGNQSRPQHGLHSRSADHAMPIQAPHGRCNQNRRKRMPIPRIACLLPVLPLLVGAASVPSWVAGWTASAHGPYPVGNPTAQPELKFALPAAETGASDQSFRLIVRPDVWGGQARLRLSNAFGTRAVTFDDVHVGLQTSGAALVPHTNRAVSFNGKQSVVVEPGRSVLSDPVALPWVKGPTDPMLANRKLAVSFHVGADTGPITWHAKALTTSYLSAPHSGMHGGEDGEANFPLSTTSWFFLDEIEMTAPGTRTLVAFGDSITDGTASTLNGDDRWPDVLSRRLHAAMGARWDGSCHLTSYPPCNEHQPKRVGLAIALPLLSANRAMEVRPRCRLKGAGSGALLLACHYLRHACCTAVHPSASKLESRTMTHCPSGRLRRIVSVGPERRMGPDTPAGAIVISR